MLNFMPADGIGVGHDLSVSKDSNRVYLMQLGLGVAGFRVDMASSLVKDDPGFVVGAKER